MNRRTGGYGYDRRVLAEAAHYGLDLVHIALPDGFPCPDEAARQATLTCLATLPADHPVLIDGLAYGAFDSELLSAIKAPIMALVHHPLAYENGLSADLAEALKRSERAALARAAHIIVTSAPTRALLIDDYHVAAERISVAVPGTDAAPRARGSGDTRPHILGVGSLTPRKAWPVLIQALAQCMDYEWSARIIGEGPERAALTALIEMYQLQDRLHLTGEVDDEGLARAYDQADLFVMPSAYEGFGMALTEALARGLPAIASDGVVALQHLAPDAVMSVKAGDDQGFTQALRLMLDPQKRRQAAQRAEQAAPSLPRWQDTTRLIVEQIRSIRA